MTAFSLTESYANDWFFCDFVETVSWERSNLPDGPEVFDGLKGRREDVKNSQYLPIAAGLGLSSSAAAFVVWQPTIDDSSVAIEPNKEFEPTAGDILVDSEKTRWLVGHVEQSRVRRKWFVIVDREHGT